MDTKQIGSTVKIEIADSVKCVSCGKQLYAMETPYVCHDCWKSGKVGKYIATQAAEIERLVKNIADYKKVTNVLGAGIGQIAVPDGFFALWNETEIEGSMILNEHKVKS